MRRLERLADRHQVDEFDCGNAALDRWLRESARTADRKGVARVYVWAESDGRVAAYAAIAPHVIERESVPRRLGRGDPDQIPAVLVAKLALDKGLHGRGLGSQLLIGVLGVIAEAADRAGGRYVVVDAADQSAAAFYQRHGFRAGPDPDRLVLRVADILATFQRAASLRSTRPELDH
jgi:GNAT superfamily N-acetyltransferase